LIIEFHFYAQTLQRDEETTKTRVLSNYHRYNPGALIIDLSEIRDTVRQAIVIPSAARNLLFSHPKADSSGFALGMTLSNQVCHLLRKVQ
jgi:hypothetical protein